MHFLFQANFCLLFIFRALFILLYTALKAQNACFFVFKCFTSQSTISFMSARCHRLMIIIIIIISIFKEDNVFSIIASLPYGPPMNTDIDYYQT